MRKQIISGILAFSLLFALPVCKSQAKNLYGDFEYDFLADGTVEIVCYYQPMYDVDHLVIPETIEGYPVTSIRGLGNCQSATVVIPDTVTTIQRMAFFSCTDLTNIKLSKNLKTIEEYAFYGNSNLERIAFPDGLLEIGEQAFVNCAKMDSIIVPSSLQSVGWQAFDGCKVLNNVYYKGTETEWEALSFFNSNVANQAVVYCDFDLQPGDMNGDGTKNMLDAMSMYASVSGQIKITPLYSMLADINCDARLNMTDVLELYQSLSGA